MSIPWIDILTALQSNQQQSDQDRREQAQVDEQRRQNAAALQREEEDRRRNEAANAAQLAELQRQTSIIQADIDRRRKEEEEAKRKAEELEKLAKIKEEDRRLHDFSSIDKDELRKAIEYASSIEDKEETLGEAFYFDELDAGEYGL